MKVDKNLLKKEKLIYGDDFTSICESWSLYLGIKLTPKDIAMMMSQMKDTRVRFVQDKINELRDQHNLLIANDLSEAIAAYKCILKENQQKKAHYLFIATNFDEYKKL